MTRPMLSRAAPFMVGALALALVACSAGGAGSPGPSGSTGPTPSGPSTTGPLPGGEIGAGLVVSVTEVGGFVGPDVTLGRLADIAIYRDGRVFQPGAVDAIFPGPLLPPLLQTTVSSAGIQAVLDLARQDGLADHDQSYLTPIGADMPDTIITVVVNGKAVIGRFSSLGASGSNLTDPAEIAARAKASDFLSRLTGYPSVLAPYQVGQSQPYVPTAVQIVARLGDPSAGVEPSMLARQPLVWPLAAPLTAFGQAVPPTATPLNVARCGTVAGDDLKLLWPLLQQATGITGFSSGGVTWKLTPMPLLPGQSDRCIGRTDQLQTVP
ncbi:MAG TPA: hypothetical protein VID25_01450 [Candidatus Limnocylindrales bacterium]